MKTIFTAVIASVLLASSVSADMSQGDGARVPMADGTGHATFSRSYVPVPVRATPVACKPGTDTIQAPTCGPVAGTSWQAFPPVVASAKELDAQRRAHEAARDEWACYGDIRPISCVWGTSHNGGSAGGSD